MKKWLFGILIALLLFGRAGADGENLLKNGGFEDVNASGMPDGWYIVAYNDTDGITQFEITSEQAHSGRYSAKIANAELNDARYVTFINVEPESVYRVSGYILVTEMSDVGNGANFALEDLASASDNVFWTDGEWKYVEWYGETDTGQTSIELGVRVGGFSAESKGTAYFDDIRVEKVDSVPQNVYADLWFNYQKDSGSVQTQALTEEKGQKSTALFIVLGLLFAGLVTLGARYMLAENPLKPGKPQAVIGGFALLLMGAFALRLVLGGGVAGYGVDIGCFSAWSQRMAAVGPLNFYMDGYFCDYPPGYMLLLWPVGQLISLVGYSQSAGILILVKSVPIVCDMLTAMLLFSFARKRISMKAAAFIALFFAFNPAVLVTGSAWGQADSVLTLFLLAAAIPAMEKKWRLALPAYVLAILVKPQALLFGPVALLWLLASFAFDTRDGRKPQYKQLWQGALLSLAAAAAVVVPFSIRQQDPLWLWKLYASTLSSYNYAVLNTANLAYLLGGNWSALTAAENQVVKVLSAWLPAATGTALLFLGLWKLNVQKGFRDVPARLKALWQGLTRREAGTDDGRKFVLAALCAVFGLAFLLSALWPSTFLAYGMMWMAFVYLGVFLLILVERKAQSLPFYMALMLIGVYVLGLKIHERYLFAACALLPLAYIGTRDRRLLWLCAGLSVTTFINVAIVLDNEILFGAVMGHLNADTAAVNDTLSITNLLLFGFSAVIAYTGLQPSKPFAGGELRLFAGREAHQERLLHPKDARYHLNMRDALVMGITFVVYCVVAFTNLGSTKAPQTAWVAASGEDQAVFELAENTTFKLAYYAGVSYHNFSVSVSDDGVNWSEKTVCRMRQSLCYRWIYITPALTDEIDAEDFVRDSEANIVWLKGKYLRVNAEFAGLNLWEILLRDESGDRIPVSLVSYNNAEYAQTPGNTPANLIDEQDTFTGEPGWYNGTYFDEIYHARTAYEHLHGIAPFETSHPPLGKEIMAVGIAIFGMTPFGWRFMGTLVGALMLPAMYLFGLQLTGKRKFAAFAMLFMALDLMHFTQTRLATIDSFPTLFIILSYLCMARYILADPFAVSGVKPRVLTKAYFRSLVPLLLSGFFIGCAIASKWTGLYAGAGLAVLFFYGLYRHFRAGLTAYDLNPERLKREEAARVNAVRKLLLKRIFTTLAFCFLFFLAIPALIYYLSYIPYLSPTGAVTFQRILRAQQGMLAYHSTPGLGMDHPFYSPWWQWPLILKPIWYAANAYTAAGYSANIVCIGNPIVFYIGALAMVAVFALLVAKYVRPRTGLQTRLDEPALAILAISFLAQYLPWLLVPRSMFFYHYFASLPFIILATAWMGTRIQSEKLQNGLMIGLLVAAFLLFMMFYPYVSGMAISNAYRMFLHWLPNLPAQRRAAMLARTVSGGLEGVNGFLVDVEAFLGKGMIGFDIVGLPSTAVKESRDRIRAAMLNLGYEWPMKKLTINLAPADVKKEGTSLELSIAIALLAAQAPDEYAELDKTLLLGELTLHGELAPVHGVLSMVLAARDKGITSAILPAHNAREVQCLGDITVYPAETLKQAVDHLTGWSRIQPQQQIGYEQLLASFQPVHDLKYVKGQLVARKALEIAAAGGHNLLMVGVPGSGKTMLARCMPGILPPLSYEEALETTCIHSAAGTLEAETGLMTERPFRSPHHNASLPAIVGGGVKAKPGEVSLAHNGVLFLDELPEYQRQTLEALRQPLEDGFVNVTRISGQAKYQSRCMLVASMNPCPCGNHGSKSKPCRCKPNEIKRYLARISGPLLDRIDIQIEMDAVELSDIQSDQQQEDTLTVQRRVVAARNLQLARYRDESFFCNAQMPQEAIETYCVMEKPARAMLHAAMEKFHISMRTYSRICKVGRTIADLGGHETIQPQDIAQAIHLRNLDGRYWR